MSDELLRIKQLELMLKLEQAKVNHLCNLISTFKKSKLTKSMFKMFDYVDSIKA